MKKNNKKSSFSKIFILTSVSILCLSYFLLPKNFFSKSEGNQLGMFKQKETSSVNSTVPSSLQWKDSFSKSNAKASKSSYIQYLAEKNKK